MKVKVTDSLDNVPNENVVTHLGTDRQTDQLLELLEWLFATKNQNVAISVILVQEIVNLNIDDTEVGLRICRFCVLFL